MTATHKVDRSGFVRRGQQDLIGWSRYRVILARLFLIYVCSCTAALAQSTYGSILGTITDSQGGVIASAKVILSDVGKSTERTGVSNPSGDYSFTNVGPGLYNLT